MQTGHLLKCAKNDTGFDQLCTLHKYNCRKLVNIANDAKNLVFCAQEILEIVR